MALIGLEVDGGARRNPDLIADDLEEPGRVIGDCIGVAVAGIRIDVLSVATVVPAEAFSSTDPPVSVISVGSSIRSLTVRVITSE